MKQKIFTKISIFSLALFLVFSACSKGSSGNGGDKPTPTKDKIVVAPESQSIFSNGLRISNSSTSQAVKFTASESWTASVVSSSSMAKASGWVTINPTSGGAGSATITVKAQENTSTNSRTATVTIKCGSSSKSFSIVQTGVPIVAVTSVTLNKTSLPLVKGNSETLTATVKPDDATDKTVSWSSSSASVATVDNNGKVTAVGGGNATITATAGGKSATCSVTVTVPVSSVTINKTSLPLVKGESETLTATISPTDATVQTVEWSTSNSEVASVDNNGKVTAVAGGEATITVSVEGKSATCIVIVTVPVSSVSLNKVTLTLFVGKSETLTANVSPDDATDKTVEWQSSKTSVATVDNTGKVQAVAIGKTTITVTCGGKRATCEVSVVKDGSWEDRDLDDV